MQSSAARASFAVLLALSLVGKLVASAAVPEPDSRLFVEAASARIVRAGLAPSVVQGHLGPIVYGRTGGCTLMVREAKEGTTYDPAYRQAAASVGSLSYLYDGRRFDAPPRILPLARHYAWRGLLKLGFATPRHPLIAIAASRGCDLARLDLAPLATLPR